MTLLCQLSQPQNFLYVMFQSYTHENPQGIQQAKANSRKIAVASKGCKAAQSLQGGICSA